MNTQNTTNVNSNSEITDISEREVKTIIDLVDMVDEKSEAKQKWDNMSYEEKSEIINRKHIEQQNDSKYKGIMVLIKIISSGGHEGLTNLIKRALEKIYYNISINEIDENIPQNDM